MSKQATSIFRKALCPPNEKQSARRKFKIPANRVVTSGQSGKYQSDNGGTTVNVNVVVRSRGYERGYERYIVPGPGRYGGPAGITI